MKQKLKQLWLWLVAIVATMFIAFAVLTGIGAVAMGFIAWFG